MNSRPSLRLSRGSDGLPIASALEVRVSRIATAIATAWMALVASWEMLGPVLAGHWAAAASMGIIAENMLRWGIVGPVWDYTETRPGPEMFYCHHPWGIFWVTAFFMKIFGRHDVVCRLPAIVLSTLTPAILYALGRAIWRPASGAAAALAFVVLPITLAFANFNVLEVPLMFWTLVAIWGWVRLSQTNRSRYLVASAVGLVMALHTDWPAYVLSGLLLGFWLFRGYLGGRRMFGPVHERRYAEAWIAWATLSVLSGVFYLAVFQKSGKLGDLLASYGMRSSGNSVPLSAVLASRRYWIELSFTPIAIALGKIAAIVSVVRLVVTRADVEFIPLAYLGMATFQYVVFKQGADIHVFWPQPFGAYFALAMGALVATVAPGIEFVRGIIRRARGLERETNFAASGLVALALFGPVFAAILRDGAPAAVYARRTGGRFNEKGLPIASDGDKTTFLRDVAQRLSRTRSSSSTTACMRIGRRPGRLAGGLSGRTDRCRLLRRVVRKNHTS
ncbi:MAG: glycosyltransferase family 39 protein [Polyangiaceae bacterium]|nr:glycosyltransferase family 39 protein [Polyangiaceae bacterium]